MTEKSRYNEKFYDILEELNFILTKRGEGFRANAYKRAAEQIILVNEPITSVDQISQLKGIGKGIIEKLTEFVETGKINLLEKEKASPINVLTDVYGIGKKKAEELITQNITTIEQLKKNLHLLNDKQKIGVKYYHDILQRIPRDEIIEFEKILIDIFNTQSKDGDRFDIMGSYRRKKETSGDIDILFTNSNNDASVFDRMISHLSNKGYIKEFLSKGKIKSMVILQLPNKTPRRVDFMYAPIKEHAFTLLYFTGSKYFNVAMRAHALQMNLTLNEHSFSYIKNHIKGDNLDQSFKTENDIFKFLKLKYKEPEERIDGRSVELLSENADKSTISSKSSPSHTKKNTKETALKKNTTIKIKKSTKTEINLNEFLRSGISFLELIKEKDLMNMILMANETYYNKKPVMTDEQYDILKDYFDKKFPTNKIVTTIGAPIKSNKEKLPYPMPSMNKIKPSTNALDGWKEKYEGPYIISNKLDGVSGLYTTEGDTPKLYTRGDGEYGKNISHLIPYLKLPSEGNLTIRGEFLMSKKTFESKYKDQFANSRNLVSGIINQQKIDIDKFNDLDFVAYEVLSPSIKPNIQFELLEKLNIKVVSHAVQKSITNDLLSNYLINERQNYEYEIDGIIVMDNKIYKRENKNPEHAFAFKMIMSDQYAESTVVDVIWSPSKDGYLKPRVQIIPVELCGVTIEYLTGFNGLFIKENKIGIGAVIQFIRSGDVIPHITKTIKPAPVPKMPTVDFVWNKTNIDIMLENPEQDTIVQEKIITLFFKTLDVEGISSGNVSRLMKAGFTTIESIIKMEIKDYLTVEGFKEVLSTKIYNSIHEKIESASLPKLMSATNLFGRNMGEKRIEIILNTYPNLLNNDNLITVEDLMKIKGLADKTASQFLEKMPLFKKFMKDANLENKLVFNPKKIDHENPLYNKKIVVTGFRNKPFEDLMKQLGVNISSTVTKDVFAIIAKNKTDISTKLEKGQNLGIHIYALDEFMEKYNLN